VLSFDGNDLTPPRLVGFFFFLVVAWFDTDVVVFVWWSEDLWASQTCLSISSDRLDVI
jgi:hypothetical protein